MIINSIYMTVKNMKRGIEFYKKLFMKEPSILDANMTSFDLNGFCFLLYTPKSEDENVIYGNNCVPNFEVQNIQGEYERVKKFTSNIDSQIDDHGEVKLFQFQDPEGNILEIYEWNKEKNT